MSGWSCGIVADVAGDQRQVMSAGAGLDQGLRQPQAAPSLPQLRAKREAKDGPVFITDRGKSAHVLLSIEDYERLTRLRRTLLEALFMPGMEDIEFNIERPKTSPSLRIPDFDID